MRVRELGCGADVAADDLRCVHMLFADQVEDLPETFVLVACRVLRVLIRTKRSREHTEERDLADVRVGDRLEHEGRERLVRRRVARLVAARRRSTSASRSSGDGTSAQISSASRSIPTRCVADATSTGAIAPETTAACMPVATSFSSSSPSSRYFSRSASSPFGCGFDEAASSLFDLRGEIARKILLRPLGVLLIVGVALHLQEVDDTVEVVLLSDREVQRERLRPERVLQLLRACSCTRRARGPSC